MLASATGNIIGSRLGRHLGTMRGVLRIASFLGCAGLALLAALPLTASIWTVIIAIAYQDGDGRSTERVIQPFAVAYYTGATLICAWCELRNDVRHFRTDRVVSADVLEESFSTP
jgi:hypothetical protein